MIRVEATLLAARDAERYGTTFANSYLVENKQRSLKMWLGDVAYGTHCVKSGRGRRCGTGMLPSASWILRRNKKSPSGKPALSKGHDTRAFRGKEHLTVGANTFANESVGLY
jgi:hypothetical protein